MARLSAQSPRCVTSARTRSTHLPRGWQVTRLNVDKDKNEVVLVGTKTAVEAARLYMDTHLQYLTNFETEQRESEKLRQAVPHALRALEAPSPHLTRTLGSTLFFARRPAPPSALVALPRHFPTHRPAPPFARLSPCPYLRHSHCGRSCAACRTLT